MRIAERVDVLAPPAVVWEQVSDPSRVLDFFALVNGCLARGVADPDLVRDFLLFYYLWWRDEIMDPLRKTQRILADVGRLPRTGRARRWRLTGQGERFLDADPKVQTAFLLAVWWHKVNWLIAFPSTASLNVVAVPCALM